MGMADERARGRSGHGLLALLAACLVTLGACHHGPATHAEVGPQDEPWIGTWAASPQAFIPGSLERFDDQTVRIIVHTSVGGARARIRISNAFGDRPLVIGAAHVARRASGADVDPASDRAVTFGSAASTTIAAGATAVSDPVSLDVPARGDLAVSLFFPEPTAATTSHALAMQTSYVGAPGRNVTAAAIFPVARTLDSWPFVTGVDVGAPDGGGFTLVAFGDSTVDGDGSTPDTNRRWPDQLAARLGAAGNARVGILNEGLIGNRLLRDSPHQPNSPFGDALGAAGVTRFDRDVLAQPAVRVVLVRIGVNDIGFPGSFASATEAPTAEGLVAGYRKLIAQARSRGVRIIGTTLTPFEDAKVAAGYYTPEKEAVRQQVNAWLRDGHELDAVVDLDAVLRDPTHPTRLLPRYDSGDHLHPNDAGYAAAADAVPLKLLERL
jgi:lysophospholipase L1-like esterase